MGARHMPNGAPSQPCAEPQPFFIPQFAKARIVRGLLSNKEKALCVTSSADFLTSRGSLKAIGLMCAAIFLFSFLDAAAKYLTSVAKLPPLEVAWFRFTCQVLFTLVIYSPAAIFDLRNTNRLGLQVIRSVFLVSATVFNFFALIYLQLDQTVTIFFLTPLIVAALAGPLLGEWVGWRRLIAIFTGFFGVLLVTRPGFGGIHWAVILSFGAMLSYSLYNIATRYLAAHDSTKVTYLYSPLAGAVLLAPMTFADWQWPADLLSWMLLASLGVTGGIGHLLLIMAHRISPASVLAPFTYTGLITMTVLGYAVFGDVPTVWTLAGGAVVIGSGLYLFYREKQMKDVA